MSSSDEDQSSSSQSEDEQEQDQEEVSDNQDDGVAPAKAAGKSRKKREPSAAGGKKKKRDPNHPKGPLTPYMFFGKEMRKKLAGEFPGANFSELGKKLGERWRLIPAAEKAPYELKAKEDKVRYNAEMVGYVPAEAESGDDEPEKKKRKKDPNAPKRPLSAFLIYSGEVRGEVKAKNPSDKIGDVAKKIGIMWGALTDEQKKPYQEKQANLKADYDVLKAQFGTGK